MTRILTLDTNGPIPVPNTPAASSQSRRSSLGITGRVDGCALRARRMQGTATARTSLSAKLRTALGMQMVQRKKAADFALNQSSTRDRDAQARPDESCIANAIR